MATFAVILPPPGAASVEQETVGSAPARISPGPKQPPMNKAASAGSLRLEVPRGGTGMKKSSSGQLIAAAAARLHKEDRWEAEGGWNPSSTLRRRAHSMERDDSMVCLLNLLDPQSLLEGPPQGLPDHESATGVSSSNSSNGFVQHSALSLRGVVLLGSISAFAWYLLRLFIRDRLVSPRVSHLKQSVLELHALSSFHSLGWVAFLAHKMWAPAAEFPKYCSRALVASLGFYLHDCWALRTTVLHSPAQLAHQASVAVTIASVLRSKGVAWLAPPLMSLSVPTLVQELLQLCGTMELPATRPEVLGLRVLWFSSFVASRLALVPLWLKHHEDPELHQPNLFIGKVSYLAGLALNLHLIASAARDLPRFLLPSGAFVPARRAYRVPLRSAQAVGSAVVAAGVLGTIFGSYFAAPATGVLALLAVLGRSSFAGPRLRALAGCSCAMVALDQLLPTSTECSPMARMLLPFLRAVKRAFRHRLYPDEILSEKKFPRDRHHLVAVTPHGFFPWGAALVVIELLDQGYLPTIVGASVLGQLPVAGRLVRFFGFQPATRSAIARCLQKPYPRNVTVIIPGGIREMFCSRQDVELSLANSRTGFVEQAVNAGAMLVPGYCFGSSRLYTVADGWIGKFFERLSRRLKTSVNLFFGRWGTLLPYPHPLACALGESIDTREIRDVPEVLRLWTANLRRAFDTHKAEFGWEEQQLYFEGEELPAEPESPWDSYVALPTSKL